MHINVLEGRAGYVVVMGRVSVTIFIMFSDNRNGKIYQWKLFYWEFSCIEIQYVGTKRHTNVIINNNYKYFLFRRRAALFCENVNRFVSVNYSALRKRSNANLVFLFSFLLDMNKFFEKHIWSLKHVYSSCSMLTMVSLIKNIYCIKHPHLSMPMLIRV